MTHLRAQKPHTTCPHINACKPAPCIARCVSNVNGNICMEDEALLKHAKQIQDWARVLRHRVAEINSGKFDKEDTEKLAPGTYLTTLKSVKLSKKKRTLTYKMELNDGNFSDIGRAERKRRETEDD